MGALGGRAAEDVVFGHQEVTTGAGGDIPTSRFMARQMVTRFWDERSRTCVPRGWQPGSVPWS